MKIPKWAGSLGLYSFMISFGFFCFSMFAWQGYNVVTRQSANPVIAFAPQQDFENMLWLNNFVLGLTIISVVVWVAGLVLYIYADE